MKALTICQPHASLVGIGVKPVETRSWSTKYRGPLAIHAGTKRPEMMHLPPLVRGRRPEDEEHNWQTWLVIDTITDPAYQGPQPQGRRIPKRATTPTLFYPHAGPYARIKPGTEHSATLYLPLGAVVATCTLVDVVPTSELRWTELIDGWGWAFQGGLGQLTRDDRLRILPTVVNVGQQAYGDFASGRFAWLLDNIKPLPEPVPAKGRQGLWEWRP